MGIWSFTGKGKLMIAFAAIANDVPTQSVTVWEGRDLVGAAFERVNTQGSSIFPFSH